MTSATHPSEPRRIEVAAALVFRDGRLLITQRFPASHLGGLWEFPGGKREPGESWEGCLARELDEELGIDIRAGELVEKLDHDYPEKSVHLRFFKCEWMRREPRPIGCPDFRWVRRDELETYEFPAADARLLDMLRNHPEWWR
jgi:mutator protein MutT